MPAFRNIKRELAKFVIEIPFIPQAGQDMKEYTLTTNLLTLNVPQGCYEVLVQALDQNIRYSVNQTQPTAASGHRLTAGNDPIRIFYEPNRTTLRFIAETSGATLVVTYGE